MRNKEKFHWQSSRLSFVLQTWHHKTLLSKKDIHTGLEWHEGFFFFYSKLCRCHTSSYFIITHWEREKVQCRLAATHSHIHAATFSRKWKRHQPESTTAPCVSLQHVDVAALLIKYNACVNATDKWAFTPLHEAAQKGRTQLCALLLAHGADPTLRNQEGQSPLDLVTVFTLCVCLLDKSPRGKKIFLLLVFRLSTVPFIFATLMQLSLLNPNPC